MLRMVGCTMCTVRCRNSAMRMGLAVVNIINWLSHKEPEMEGLEQPGSIFDITEIGH